MKTLFSIFLSILLLNLNSQVTKKALFLGNSYTYYNGGLPATIQNLAQANGDNLVKSQNTPGGYSLEGHSTNALSLEKIKESNWDYVVLQGQSQNPSFPPSQVATQVKPYAVILNDSIKANNSCTKTMFFMTWGKKNGDAGNCAGYPILCTFEGVTQRLRESYLEMTVENNAECAPVGVAWKKAVEDFPLLELFNPDGSHPSYAGTYLSACVFYSSMFHKTTVGNTYWSTLDSITAYRLQVIASETVLDSLDVWKIETSPANYEVIDSNIVFCDSTEFNGTWFYSDTTINDSSNIVGSCMTIINFDLSKSLTPTIEYLGQIMLLKTESINDISINFSAVNFDSLFLYKDNVLISVFLPNSNYGYLYACDESLGESLEFILVAKNNCGTDSLTKTLVCSIGGGISSFDKFDWEITPNPTNTYINIVSSILSSYSISLIDLSGKELISKQESFQKNSTIDVRQFDKGIYFLVIYDLNGIPIGQQKVLIN